MSHQDAAELSAVIEAEQSPVAMQPSPEQITYRALIASFKQAVKDDAPRIRTWKREVSQSQKADGPDAAALEQSRLSAYRVEARARLLIYGTLRGRSWARMEPKHAETNGRLRYYVARVWNAVETEVSMPPQLKEFQ